MSNFYTEQEVPLRKIRAVTHSRGLMLTQLPRIRPKLPLQLNHGPSPLWAVSKLVLSQLHRPFLDRKETCQSIQKRRIHDDADKYIRKQLQDLSLSTRL